MAPPEAAVPPPLLGSPVPPVPEPPEPSAALPPVALVLAPVPPTPSFPPEPATLSSGFDPQPTLSARSQKAGFWIRRSFEAAKFNARVAMATVPHGKWEGERLPPTRAAREDEKSRTTRRSAVALETFLQSPGAGSTGG